MGYWRDRTPEGFTFNVKAFSLLTQHPTRPGALYKDLREKVPDKRNLYPRDIPETVVEEVWQRRLDGLTTPCGEVVQAGDAGVEFMESLAHGIPCPAQEEGGLSLAEAEGLDRLGHEAPATGTVEGIGGLHQPRAHRRAQFHRSYLLR